MCLTITNNQTSKVATKDIICYKYLHNLEDKLYTPVFENEIKIGNTYESKLIMRDEYDDKAITVGLHSYLNMKTIDNVTYCKFVINHRDVIVECIIPKGSVYYTGYHSNKRCEGYASDTIVYKRIVPVEEYINNVIEACGSIDYDRFHLNYTSLDEVMSCVNVC